MKKLAAFILCIQVMILLKPISVYAHEASNVIELQCEDTFEALSVNIIDQEHCLLAGHTGTGDAAVPAVYCTRLDGRLMWEHKTDNTERTFYMAYKHGGEYFALCAPDDNMSTIVKIQEGERKPFVSYASSLLRMCPSDDEIYFFQKPSFDKAVIIKAAYDGKVVWERKLENPYFFYDIIAAPDGVIALGYWREDYDSIPKGIVLKLDLDGNILWEHLSEENCQFKSGICKPDGSVVVVGDTENTLSTASDYTHGFVACYDERGQVWWSNYQYGERTEGNMASILAVPDGYIIACDVRKHPSQIRIVLVDKAGNYIDEWEEVIEPVCDSLYFSLFNINGRYYLIANGRMEPTTSIDGTPRINANFKTVLKEILL